MDINLGIWHMIDDIGTGLNTNLRTFHRIILITSLGKHFEGKRLVSQFFPHVGNQFFTYVVK